MGDRLGDSPSQPEGGRPARTFAVRLTSVLEVVEATPGGDPSPRHLRPASRRALGRGPRDDDRRRRTRHHAEHGPGRQPYVVRRRAVVEGLAGIKDSLGGTDAVRGVFDAYEPQRSPRRRSSWRRPGWSARSSTSGPRPRVRPRSHDLQLTPKRTSRKRATPTSSPAPTVPFTVPGLTSTWSHDKSPSSSTFADRRFGPSTRL